MSEAFLNCPYCNGKAMFVADSKELVVCSNITCHMNYVIVRKTAWNTRPTPTPEQTEKVFGYTFAQIKKAINWCIQHGFDIEEDPEELKKPYLMPTPEAKDWLDKEADKIIAAHRAAKISTQEIRNWETELDDQWSSINAPADNQSVKGNVKAFIRSILAAKTGEPGLRELEEEELIKAAQKFCRETYDMTGEREEYHEKFGALICFIKDVLVPHFARPVVSNFPEKYNIQPKYTGEALEEENSRNIQFQYGWNACADRLHHHLLEEKSVGVPAGKEIVWPHKKASGYAENLNLTPGVINEAICWSDEKIDGYNAAIDEFERLNPHLKRTEP